MRNEFKEISKQRLSNHDSISLADIIRGVARQIKIVIIVPAVFCTLSIINVLYLVRPQYTSTAKIMSSSSSSSGISQAAGLAAQFGLSIPSSSDSKKWLYPDIIKSRTLSKSMLQRKFNSKEFGPQKSLLFILTGNNSEMKDNERVEIMAIDKFISMISLSEDLMTGIYTISITASEAKLAYEINKTFIEELDLHQKEYNTTKTIDTRLFIEDRIAATERELNFAENSLREFYERNRRIENSPTLKLESKRLSREVDVLTGVFTTLKQQLETTKIEEMKESDYVITIDPPVFPIYPSKPKKRKTVILAGFLGIFAGFLIGFFREYSYQYSKKEKKDILDSLNFLVNNFFKIFKYRK